jgi:hypothetical protein
MPGMVVRRESAWGHPARPARSWAIDGAVICTCRQAMWRDPNLAHSYSGVKPFPAQTIAVGYVAETSRDIRRKQRIA